MLFQILRAAREVFFIHRMMILFQDIKFVLQSSQSEHAQSEGAQFPLKWVGVKGTQRRKELSPLRWDTTHASLISAYKNGSISIDGYACLNPCMCFSFIHRKWNERWHLFRKCKLRFATWKHLCAVEHGNCSFSSKAEPQPRTQQKRWWKNKVLFILSRHHLRKMTRGVEPNRLKSQKTAAEDKPIRCPRGHPISSSSHHHPDPGMPWSQRKPLRLSDHHSSSPLSKHSPSI